MPISDLPNELILDIILYLPLKELIAATGVNKRWRQLVPLADLIPARRGLLDLYLTAIQRPAFSKSRPRILPHLVPFDRQAYVAAVAASNCDEPLPELFQFWLLEWPAKATISWHWPGISPRHSSPSSPSRFYLDRNCFDINGTRVQTETIYKITKTERLAMGMSRTFETVKAQAVKLTPHQLIILGGDVQDLKGRVCFMNNIGGDLVSYSVTWQEYMLEMLEDLGGIW
jgi:hypothetical protein